MIFMELEMGTQTLYRHTVDFEVVMHHSKSSERLFEGEARDAAAQPRSFVRKQ